MLLSGASGTGKTRLARALANHWQRPLITLRATELPLDLSALRSELLDVLCEATLRDGVVVLDDCEAVLSAVDGRRRTVLDCLDHFGGRLLLLTSTEPARLDDSARGRIAHQLALQVPDAAARRQLFEVHLPTSVAVDNDVDLESLASCYEFNGAVIRNAVTHARRLSTADAPQVTMAHLDAGCRAQLIEPEGGLIVRSHSKHRLSDIVLDTRAETTVRELISACRNQGTVLSRWGFGDRLATGKGLIALFDGPPGTGKTYCAEIVAAELGRPLHRVNIAEVVSKWAGETEKQIRRIFQEARMSRGVLLFDEADSLFSQRVSETRSASDRHANMEVNLLLQEIERFEGVCILTTNFFGALDAALVRRIQFRVSFAEPDAAQRALIWRKLCPARAPLDEDVSFERLGEDFDLTGAMVKNALLRAAYRCCEAGRPLHQQALVEACRDEGAAAGRVVRLLAHAA